MKLQRLNRGARRLMTPEFVRGQGDGTLATDLWEPFAEPVEPAMRLDEFAVLIDDLIATTAPFSTAIDARAAVEFHGALRLSRRAASDEGIWRFLAVAFRPNFVRHRWENPTFSVGRSRFWSFGTRPDSNVFARLWWIAELTHAGDDYELTRRVLASQSIANQIFTRSFCEHRPCVQACVDAFEGRSPDESERLARELHHALSTRVLETMSVSELADLLSELSG